MTPQVSDIEESLSQQLSLNQDFSIREPVAGIMSEAYVMLLSPHLYTSPAGGEED